MRKTLVLSIGIALMGCISAVAADPEVELVELSQLEACEIILERHVAPVYEIAIEPVDDAEITFAHVARDFEEESPAIIAWYTSDLYLSRPPTPASFLTVSGAGPPIEL